MCVEDSQRSALGTNTYGSKGTRTGKEKLSCDAGVTKVLANLIKGPAAEMVP